MTTQKQLEELRAVKRFIREPYAWPGGYPLALLMHDGECLCVKCTRENFRAIARATFESEIARDSGWHAADVFVNWEDSNLFCANCNARIESAYAEDETAPADKS